MTDPPEPTIATVFTPIRSDVCKLELLAYSFESAIDLNLLQTHYLPAQILSADPLVLLMPANAHVVVLHFGAVVFWQCPKPVCVTVLEKIQQVMKMDPPQSEVRDALVVLVGQPEDRVNFKDIRLQNLTLEHVRIISETLGRSVALGRCESSVAMALKNTTPIVQVLEARGELTPSAKNILKTVGFTLAVRDAILSKLGLFDVPAETWQSERLSRLHNQLYDHLDIKKRLSGLHEKVSFLSDLNQLLMTLLQNRTSHRLEWIVILLIVIEVVFSFVNFFSGPHR